MDRQKLMARLTRIFDDVMDLDGAELTENSTAADFDEWDSLSHVRLIVSIERQFAVKFTNAEIENFNRFGDIVDLLVKKGVSA